MAPQIDTCAYSDSPVASPTDLPSASETPELKGSTTPLQPPQKLKLAFPSSSAPVQPVIVLATHTPKSSPVGSFGYKSELSSAICTSSPAPSPLAYPEEPGHFTDPLEEDAAARAKSQTRFNLRGSIATAQGRLNSFVTRQSPGSPPFPPRAGKTNTNRAKEMLNQAARALGKAAQALNRMNPRNLSLKMRAST
mmetsp:Transcript_32017/g.90861  ORF Transcript_32017/g.90861 Transcript_32017/m.90861 type:complete len:194 (+) Transcript_32017:235-816(+)